MKKMLLASVAALFLATGTAHANHQAYYQCGKDLIFVNMGKGFTDYALVLDKRTVRCLVAFSDGTITAAFCITAHENANGVNGHEKTALSWCRCAVPGNRDSACC
jgi:hypothetical protein